MTNRRVCQKTDVWLAGRAVLIAFLSAGVLIPICAGPAAGDDRGARAIETVQHAITNVPGQTPAAKTSCTSCLPAQVSYWRANQFYGIRHERTKAGQRFLSALRTVIAAAVCNQNSTALVLLNDVAQQAKEPLVTEAEAVILDHQATQLGKTYGFRARVREKEQQMPDTARNVHQVSAVSQALRSEGVTAAAKTIQSFAEICTLVRKSQP